MTFAEKLKSARKEAGMSQEVLAEKLGVSRQAVTKWETDRGIPDIDNMMTVSNLFGISVDEFLSEEKDAVLRMGYLYESATEYDVDGRKHFDIKLGGAKSVRIIGTTGEKIKVKLCSDDITSLEQDYKVKIDDIKNRIDVDVNRQNKATEAVSKTSLFIEVLIPNQYLSHVEIAVNCEEITLNNIDCEHIEFSGRTTYMSIESISGRLEVDCNLDMVIKCDSFSGSLEINQISSTSKLTIKDTFSFRSVVKGIGTSVSFKTDDSDDSDYSDENSDNIIEFNGLKSELVINRIKGAF